MKKYIIYVLMLFGFFVAPTVHAHTPMANIAKNIVTNFPAQAIGHGIKVSTSSSYAIVSYMVTGKMKWVTLTAALYVYVMIREAQKDREEVSAFEVRQKAIAQAVAQTSVAPKSHDAPVVDISSEAVSVLTPSSAAQLSTPMQNSGNRDDQQMLLAAAGAFSQAEHDEFRLRHTQQELDEMGYVR